MALTNIATVGTQGPFASMVKSTGAARIKFDFDADYATGGYTSFAASVKTALSNPGITVLAVIQQHAAGGYRLIYNRATDALLVHQYPGALGPSTQVPAHTDLHLITDVEVVVLYT